MDLDCLFVPDPHAEEPGIYKRLELIFTGHHYELPIDRFDETGDSYKKYRMEIVELGAGRSASSSSQSSSSATTLFEQKKKKNTDNDDKMTGIRHSGIRDVRSGSDNPGLDYGEEEGVSSGDS